MAEQIQDRDLRAFGYTPGSYIHNCQQCRGIMRNVTQFSTRCRPCAVRALKEATAQEEKLSGDGITRIEVSADSLGFYFKYNGQQYGPYLEMSRLSSDLSSRLNKQFG